MANILLNNIIDEIAIKTVHNSPVTTSSEIANNIASNFISNIINDIDKQHIQYLN